MFLLAVRRPGVRPLAFGESPHEGVGGLERGTGLFGLVIEGAARTAIAVASVAAAAGRVLTACRAWSSAAEAAPTPVTSLASEGVARCPARWELQRHCTEQHLEVAT